MDLTINIDKIKKSDTRFFEAYFLFELARTQNDADLLKDGVETMLLALANITSKLNESEDALIFLKIYTALTKGLFNENQVTQIAEMLDSMFRSL